MQNLAAHALNNQGHLYGAGIVCGAGDTAVNRNLTTTTTTKILTLLFPF